jgi:hypothetical protein
MKIWMPIQENIMELVEGAAPKIVAKVVDQSAKDLLAAAPDLHASAKIGLELSQWIQASVPTTRWPHGLRFLHEEIQRSLNKSGVKDE